jgi:hypothetical protein
MDADLMSGPPQLEPAFASRARQEAARYGPDPWVFVRELLQNARDAGARSIRIQVERTRDLERVVCEDDGEGMSFEHARRYLFSLYASSKEGRRNRAGRFGVGFWSVLRFEPSGIEIASRPARGEAWAIRLDGQLSTAERRPDRLGAPGTRVRLERPARDAHLERRVADAVEQSARDLRQRDRSDRRIEVRVDGRSVNRPLSLPAPSVSFQRGAQRGVVGLGPAPGVELFSQGLRVRSAAALPDLLDAGSRASALTRVRFPELADGIAPRALLEGGALELSLARRDARDTRSLRRLVRSAQRELGRLVERQLERADPRPAWRRAISRSLARPLPLLLAASLVAGGLVGLVWREIGPPRATAAGASAGSAPRDAPDPLAAGHRDLARSYGGPASSGTASGGDRVLIRYAPKGAELYLGALRVEALDHAGRPVVPVAGDAPDPSLACDVGCVEVELDVSDGPGPLRLPVPPGHGVIAASVRLGALALPVQADVLGQPLVALTAPTTARLRYRAAPLDPATWRPPAVAVDLPDALAEQARTLSRLPLEARGPAALDWVRERIHYSVSDEVAARHRALADVGFLERSLAIGAGDCDVQSGVLLPLLHAAGLAARLAVGYVGRDGRASARLHAWVEYRTPLSDWTVIDASAGRSAAEASPVAAPDDPTPVAAAPHPFGGSGLPWLVAAVLACLALAVVLARRGRPRLLLPPETDVAALMRGALQRPDAFRDAPAIFHRRLLPLAGGGSVSLAEVWERAHEGRLFSTRRCPRLARAAARGGAAVLDERRPEGRAVGEMLGALPLDEWDRLLREGRSSPVLAALERCLASNGEPWSLRAADANGVEALELPARGGIARYALIPGDAPLLRDAEALWPERPRLAVLRLGEWLAERLGFGCSARLLSSLARAAVREAAG